jgi:hypothetical protein
MAEKCYSRCRREVRGACCDLRYLSGRDFNTTELRRPISAEHPASPAELVGSSETSFGARPATFGSTTPPNFFTVLYCNICLLVLSIYNNHFSIFKFGLLNSNPSTCLQSTQSAQSSKAESNSNNWDLLPNSPRSFLRAELFPRPHASISLPPYFATPPDSCYERSKLIK